MNLIVYKIHRHIFVLITLSTEHPSSFYYENNELMRLLQGSIKKIFNAKYFILPLKTMLKLWYVIFTYRRNLFLCMINICLRLILQVNPFKSKIHILYKVFLQHRFRLTSFSGILLQHCRQEISNFSSWLYIWNLSLFGKWGTSFTK